MSERHVQSWEYCLLTASQTQNTITFYELTGARIEIVEPASHSGNDDVTVFVASAIAKLGREGWELVNANSIVINQASTEMFFKRLLV